MVQLSHRHHHKNTGNIDKDEVFYPVRKSKDPNVRMLLPGFGLGIGWFMYLVHGYRPRGVRTCYSRRKKNLIFHYGSILLKKRTTKKKKKPTTPCGRRGIIRRKTKTITSGELNDFQTANEIIIPKLTVSQCIWEFCQIFTPVLKIDRAYILYDLRGKS